MKNTIFTFTFLVALYVSPSYAGMGTQRDYQDNRVATTPVEWEGSVRCVSCGCADCDGDSRCKIEFVNNENGQAWNLEFPAGSLEAAHVCSSDPIKVRVRGAASPRFLLGVSYLDVQTITVLDSTVTATCAHNFPEKVPDGLIEGYHRAGNPRI